MRQAAAIAIGVAMLTAAPSAYADAIDGEWCSVKGLNLMIEGPKIRLPSGTRIEGQYYRHQFAYKVPAGDPDNGQIIFMQLLDEETMMLRHIRDGVAGAPEIWNRCNVTS